MKIEIILDHPSTQKNNKCWNAIQRLFNSKMCSKIMFNAFGIVALMFFVGVVAFTYVNLYSHKNVDDEKSSEAPTSTTTEESTNEECFPPITSVDPICNPRPTTSAINKTSQMDNTARQFELVFDIQCSGANDTDLKPYSIQFPRSIAKESKETFIPASFSEFVIQDVDENEVIIHFDRSLIKNQFYFIYFPTNFNASNLTISQEQIKDIVLCEGINQDDINIKNLQSSMKYTFCVQELYFTLSPFDCKFHKTATPFAKQLWIDQDSKVIIVTSFVGLTLLALMTGIIMTYLFITYIIQ